MFEETWQKKEDSKKRTREKELTKEAWRKSAEEKDWSKRAEGRGLKKEDRRNILYVDCRKLIEEERWLTKDQWKKEIKDWRKITSTR